MAPMARNKTKSLVKTRKDTEAMERMAEKVNRIWEIGQQQLAAMKKELAQQRHLEDYGFTPIGWVRKGKGKGKGKGPAETGKGKGKTGPGTTHLQGGGGPTTAGCAYFSYLQSLRT